MKNISAFLIFTTLAFIYPPNLVKASPDYTILEKYSSIETEDYYGRTTICWLVSPLLTICITTWFSDKIDLRSDLKVKATLSRDGRSIRLSGFPPSLHGESFKISNVEYSGFDFKGEKMFVQPGQYKISKGSTTINLQSE